jgi:hypothetical protein
MDTNMRGCRWVAALRGALSTVAAALTVFGLTLLLKRVDAAVPQARDAVLVLLGLGLVLTVGAIDAKESQESPHQAPDRVPMEGTPWHEHAGSFRGMIG